MLPPVLPRYLGVGFRNNSQGISLKILALNPFHGGSHQAFLETWTRHSQHEFTTLTEPATRWKWRMRQSAVAFAERASQLYADASLPDAIFTTDMLNVAEFRGLAPHLATVPLVVYFHENQLTYPIDPARPKKIDLHTAFSNFSSALVADEVWFNSEFHRQEFLSALTQWLRKMPDGDLDRKVDAIQSKCIVQYPPVELLAREKTVFEPKHPPHVLWVGRWEHDKRPEVFFNALRQLKADAVPFEVSVLGESYRNAPDYFAVAKSDLGDQIRTWGYLESVDAYRNVLQTADVVVSTAVHEFFGIAIVEAVSAGCCPVVPDALAYPEVLGRQLPVFHSATVRSVTDAIRQCFSSLATRRELTQQAVSPYSAPRRAAEMDQRLREVG
ncbi:DUF3524 domain-containing protein [bacterium]|nr:DUF3524 domain-containing protein [bacterium]